MKKYSFPPIVDENCKVLILGTMPGEKSLQLHQYYANPTNQFWRIISLITNENFAVSYDEKKKLLLKHRIAIWDVLMHCEREGSMDMNISDEVPNDFKTVFYNYPNLKVLCFNGGKAAELFPKYFQMNDDKFYYTLPSTSSANTSLTFEKKASIWKEIILGQQ